MRFVCWGIVLYCLGPHLAAQGSNRFAVSGPPLDLAPLIEELVRQRPALTKELDLGYRVRLNVVHVGQTRLNRSRFLTEPSQQDIADRMEELLELNRQVGVLLGEVRHLLAGLRAEDPVSAGRLARGLAEEIGAASERIRTRFADYFVEAGPHSIEMALPTDRRLQACLALYLLNGERLHRQLTGELTDFVHGSESRQVDVAAVNSGSIRVLAKGLRLLSERLCDLIGNAG